MLHGLVQKSFQNFSAENLGREQAPYHPEKPSICKLPQNLKKLANVTLLSIIETRKHIISCQKIVYS